MQNFRPYIILVFTMMIWGFNVPLIKILVSTFEPVTITSLRIFTASLVIFLILGFMGKVHLPKKTHWKYILGGGLFNVFFHHLFLGLGAAGTSAVHTGIILGLGPILTAIMSILFLKSGISFLRIFGFFIGTAGVLVTVLGGGSGLSGMALGDLYIFISIATQAFSFIIVSRAAREMDPLLLTGYMQLFGSLGIFLASLMMEPDGLASLQNGSLTALGVFLLSACGATAIGHLVYNNTITKIGPSESAIFLNLNTFFSIVGSAVLLNEPIYYYHWLGLFLIVPGVLMGSGALEDIIRKRARARKV
ncbi:DMT family transporter [Domibacillus epiphyticus]|uniref:EamA family transporter n=1 Tax=Domibacillus epiphyticus TaxID=1714355 RepID=A0A1V2A679_9BACI|nr:DMT family transporter [Domibacillus epiphyticus]OMP66486.1 EamA family transporter [Domibacillus epiphyticus]